VSKLADATEANLLQAIADSTANIRPCPPLTFTTAGRLAVNGLIVNTGDKVDHYLITEAGRQALLDWNTRRKPYKK
jgi:hypothetical protein